MEKDRRPTATAVHIGFVCVFIYFINYCMRRLLSVTTPAMLAEGYTADAIGMMSSAYMLLYAFGQLINGRLGDRIPPRWMVFFGLVVSGSMQMLFPFVPWEAGRVLCFAITGYALSMLRGPLVKAISENTLPHHARMCCVMLTVVTYASPLAASLLVALFQWKMVFVIGGGIGVAMGVIGWLLLAWLERRGDLTFTASVKNEKRGIRELFHIDRFLLFMALSAIFEMSTTSIDAWISTYLVQHLSLNANVANLVYSGLGVMRAVCPVLCLMIFRLFREKDTRMMQVMLLLSVIMYIGMQFVVTPIANILLLFLSLSFTTIASSVLWSVYIPSLGKSGQVSSANGMLDFAGYVGAAFANLVISNAIESWGWNATLWIWCAIPAVSLLIVTLGGRQKAHTTIA